MNIHIRYFASLREITGRSEETLTLDDGVTVSDVRAVLLAREPRLRSIIERSLCAVNQAYVPAETILRDGDELVFIPPMGGGSARLWARQAITCQYPHYPRPARAAAWAAGRQAPTSSPAGGGCQEV